MLDPHLIELLASELGTYPGLIEKDWHVVRAISVLAALEHDDAIPVFSGGTSLSKGWGLIKRFSEDIDFKVALPTLESRSKERARRKAYRHQILVALASADFDLKGEVLKRNEDNFFSADFTFNSLFTSARGLRPHLRIEMTFTAATLPPIARSIQSLLSQAQQQAPEVPAFLCIDPIETAADKMSALAWRVCARERGIARDDPTIIRHLHDLAALANHIENASAFQKLVYKAVETDADRGGGIAPIATTDRFARMLERLHQEKFWSEDYDIYVRGVSFARPDERITFDQALVIVEKLIVQEFRGPLGEMRLGWFLSGNMFAEKADGICNGDAGQCAVVVKPTRI